MCSKYDIGEARTKDVYIGHKSKHVLDAPIGHHAPYNVTTNHTLSLSPLDHGMARGSMGCVEKKTGRLDLVDAF